MPLQFQIPKLSDKEIFSALQGVQKTLKGALDLFIVVDLPHLGGIDMRSPQPAQKKLVDQFQQAGSQLIRQIYLQTVTTGNNAVYVTRTPERVTDQVTITDDWPNALRTGEERAAAHALLVAAVRDELRVSETEAIFRDSGTDSWSRYRDAQATVLSSLQQATETLIVGASQKAAELDRVRAARFEKLEKELREEMSAERKKLQDDYEQRLSILRAQEKTLADKESAFNTKESHYVARQKQTEQIEKIQSWLDNWSLTKGTSRKRWPIVSAYVVALIFTGGLTAYASWHSYELLKNVDEIVKLAWWQWAGIWAKSFFPLVAFVTFMIYFIRWSGDWARQHSEEEFRNRTRLVDIGRSSWLLEAVRDAQERNKEIPTDLLRELSRNLFSTNGGQENDVHPQATSELLLQGLSSLRVRAPDGSEVEAQRSRKK